MGELTALLPELFVDFEHGVLMYLWDPARALFRKCDLADFPSPLGPFNMTICCGSGILYRANASMQMSSIRPGEFPAKVVDTNVRTRFTD